MGCSSYPHGTSSWTALLPLRWNTVRVRNRMHCHYPNATTKSGLIANIIMGKSNQNNASLVSGHAWPWNSVPHCCPSLVPVVPTGRNLGPRYFFFLFSLQINHHPYSGCLHFFTIPLTTSIAVASLVTPWLCQLVTSPSYPLFLCEKKHDIMTIKILLFHPKGLNHPTKRASLLEIGHKEQMWPPMRAGNSLPSL